jgi:transcriptional regulator with XRE-family HTH domain
METRFPNRLKEYRDIYGLSQKDVAFLLGIKGSTRIGQWERGVKTPCMTHLLKLSLIYRALVNDLYFDLLQEYKDTISQKQEQLFTRKG